MRKNIIKERSYQFSLDIISLARTFPKSQESFIISRQLLKSGTSIGANIVEATSGYSKNDFIYKMNLALKECSETEYWLNLTQDSGILVNTDVEKVLKDCLDIKNILTSIIKTSRRNLNS